MNAARFHARFQRVLEYIDAHLDGDLSVEALSGVAAFSKYHFHRQFSELFGVGVYQYVQLRRLKRASFELAFRDRKIIDVALTSGYEGPESFSRAFRKNIGQSPSEFRKRPLWKPWHAVYQSLNVLRAFHMKPEKHGQVKIIDFKETRVAVLEHRGDPGLIGDSIRRFIDWRKQNRLSPQISATFNILYDDPARTDPGSYRLDLCAAIEGTVAGNEYGVVEKTIPGGRCAVIRHTGTDDALGEIIAYLYSKWLPRSGEEPRDFPVYLQRVKFFPDVPETEAVVDIFLPLR
ncbi:MAG TPA: AraC family transcriptional regulator [Gammaproteobacteria bacterium]|nr:AraC family transcriptional regulator [Gammaproteobacteria bacterium]